LYEKQAVAAQTFAKIDDLALRSLSRLCFLGPEEELKRTINTQPTILAVSLAAWNTYQQLDGPTPAFVAGHSLGEFSALVAAQALTLDAAVRLVDKRAQLMEACATGAMSAIIGLPFSELEAICREISQQPGSPPYHNQVVVANYNTNEQLVISGVPDAVRSAGIKAKQAGAKVIPLPVGGAFHSPLMQSASQQFVKELQPCNFSDAVFPVVQNVDAKPSIYKDELKSKISAQMASPVRWSETIEFMLEQGVDVFIEIGPGKALTGMVKKISRRAQTFNIYDAQSLEEAIKQLHVFC